MSEHEIWKTIPLTQNKVALVDAEDFEFLNQWKWCAKKDERSFYAMRTEYVKNDFGKIVNRKNIYMHRVILKVDDPKIQIDHEDIDGLNNRKYNLRIATQSQNQRNKRSFKNTTSKYKGVYLFKTGKLLYWRSMIRVNGKQESLGLYKDEDAAALAYNAAAKKYYGEFANLNIIE